MPSTLELFKGQFYGTRTGLRMSEKVANIQRKTLKNLQKAGELLLKTTLRITRKSFQAKYKEMRGLSRLLHSFVAERSHIGENTFNRFFEFY